MYDKLHQLFGLSYLLHAQKYGDWRATQPLIVLVHGIGVNYNIWHNVLDWLGDQPVLAVDLLGFGQSRKPDWPDYSLTDHARALHKTIRRVAPSRPIILCGHSLGTLVSIEYAKLFPNHVQRLILCSPPIYLQSDITKQPLREAIIKTIGKSFLEAIDSSPQLISVINQYKRTQKSFHVSREGLSPFVKTARNSILHQTSLDDIIKLPPLPIAIIYGTLDGVMVPANLRFIERQRRDVTISTVLAGHEIRKRYGKVIAKLIQD